MSTVAITSSTKPTISYVSVTPDLARRWLRKNHTNRRLDWHTVEKYARIMRAGNWSLDSNAIAFDPDGNLLNGQHRLNAVALSQVSITFAVQRNVPPQAMKYMDRGRGRTVAQNLRFENEKNSTVLAATIRLLISIEEELAYIAVSDDMIYDYLDAHPAIRASVTVGANAKSDIDAPPTAIGAAHWIIQQSTQIVGAADQYIDALRTRAGEPAGSAVLAVDKRLREIRKHQQKYQTLDYVHLLIKGWNYWAANRSVAKLQMPKPGSALPRVEGWRR